MKLKKLKKLIRAVSDIGKRDIKTVKGITKTKMEASPGHPLILLPTRGRYTLPEVLIINKIIMSIEPKDLVDEARKVNFQSGMLLMSVFRHPLNPNNLFVLVHTPYGCCGYSAEMDLSEVQNKEPVEVEQKEDNMAVEFADDLKDMFEIM